MTVDGEYARLVITKEDEDADDKFAMIGIGDKRKRTSSAFRASAKELRGFARVMLAVAGLLDGHANLHDLEVDELRLNALDDLIAQSGNVKMTSYYVSEAEAKSIECPSGVELTPPAGGPYRGIGLRGALDDMKAQQQ